MSSATLLRSSTVVWVFGALAAGAGGPLQGQSGLPEIVVNGHDFRVPAGGGRMVYRFGEEGPPEVLEFFETHGRAWRVYWDETLGTPRFLRPLEPVEVVAPELLQPAGDLSLIVPSVKAFLEIHADFLGVGPAELGPPHVYRSGTSPILVFGQTTAGGTPVRGANLRVVLREDGTLSWLKSFIIGDCPDPEGEFQDLTELLSSTMDDGSAVDETRFQIGFTESDPPVAIPIWSLGVTDPQGEFSEHILDARTGALLVRRRVVKHFTPSGNISVHGWVYGVFPPRDDIFASPQETELAVVNAVDGSLVWNQGDAITRTNRSGFFLALIAEDNAALAFSLEHGVCPPGANGVPGEYERRFWVLPSDAGTQPIELPPTDDVNGDGVPDIAVAQASDVTFEVVFNDSGVQSEGYVERAWWLQTHYHTRKMFRFVEDTVTAFGLGESFQGIDPLEIRPMSGGTVQTYWPANGRDRPERVFSSIQYDRATTPPPTLHFDTFDVVPTIFSHEVGHHMVLSLTRTRENDNRQAEEGVADALTAFTNDAPEIGYQAADEPTDFGFKLGAEDEVRHPVRADVGNALWTLRVRLAAEPFKAPQVAEALLLHWLHAHWGPEGQAMRFDAWDLSMVEEMLAIDSRAPFCEVPADCTVPPHGTEILAAFRGRKTLFDAPFVRGDANVDQKIDISDAIKILDILFAGQGQFVDCWNAVDVDNDGNPDLTDAIYLLLYLFQGGVPVPGPFPGCGIDPERPGSRGNLGCADFTCER